MTQTKPVMVQARTWDRATRTLVPNGQPIAVDEVGRAALAHRAPANQFLKGPIPWRWLVRAAGLPGRALEVGLCLWRLKGLKGRSDHVLLTNAELKPFGIDRAAKSRALRALESAGLITLAHQRGRFPSVTLIT